jgi:hypothetical protein
MVQERPMSPFDTWYNANIAPMLPTDCPPLVRKASRESMAACWNAALDAADKIQHPATAEDYCDHIYSLRVAP